MIGGILAQYYAEVKVMIRAILIWTGMLFVISLFYLGEFDYSRPQVWMHLWTTPRPFETTCDGVPIRADRRR